jgi:hypothetical protein
VKKILVPGVAIAVAAIGAWLVRAWLPELARVARRLWNSLPAFRGALPSQPPMPGDPVPGSPDAGRDPGRIR